MAEAINKPDQLYRGT